MTPEDKPRFVSILTEAWTGGFDKQINTTTLSLYWRALSRFTIEEVEKALAKHIDDPIRGRYMPKVADIIYQIDGDAQPLLAWTKVIKAMTRFGYYQSIVFDDPIIHAVISDMSGWIRLCLEKESALPFYQREFERRYQNYYRSPPDVYPRELIGEINHQNQYYGYPLVPPNFIGNEERALLVYQGGIELSKLSRQSSGVLPLHKLVGLPSNVASSANEKNKIKQLPLKENI